MPVKFNTDEWYRLFEWALKEADRLGMTIGAHNCDGWSSSGGPWISPEYSMKRCVWSKTLIQGGEKTDIKLPEPKKSLDFYRDIRVLAFPAKAGANSFQKAKPVITADGSATGDLLYDGDPFSMVILKEASGMDIVFDKEFKAVKIAIHPRVEFEWDNMQNIRYQVELKASSDGRTYKLVQQFDGPAPNRTSVIEIKPATAKQFRLEFSKITGISGADLGISEVELLGNDEYPAYFTGIPGHLEKTVTTMPVKMNDLLAPGNDTTEQFITQISWI